MELLQELVHYKSLNIEKNCKEDIILFVSLWCLWWNSPIFSMPACAANNRKTAITCCSNFVCLNNCLSLNLQTMVNRSKTMVFWKLVCTFCYIVSKKISSKGRGDSYKINAAREESSRHSVPGCRSKAKCTWNAKISTETVPVFLLKIRPRIFVGEINWIEQKTSGKEYGCFPFVWKTKMFKWKIN